MRERDSHKNYYKRAGTAPNEKYLLDALVLVGYNVDSFSKLDDTNEDRTQAHFDNQYHQLHAVEITAATAVFDILNGAINTDPNNNCDRIAGYNVFNETEADGDLRITAYNFFAEYDMYLFCGSGRNRNEKNQLSGKTNLQKKNKINICTACNYNVNAHIR